MGSGGRGMAKYSTGGHKDASGKIIPFFEQYPLLGNKALDFDDYRRVAFMMCDGLHKTPEGLAVIKKIAEGTNTGRDYSLKPTMVVSPSAK